jgi:hypothetical protein
VVNSAVSAMSSSLLRRRVRLAVVDWWVAYG